MRSRSAIAIAALAGVLTAASLPPFRFWWLAPVGYAGLTAVLLDRGRRQRLLVAGMFFLSFFTVGLAWMVEFSIPGAVLLVLLESALVAAFVLVVPRSRGAAFLAVPAVVVLAEMARYRLPLGGLPMAGPALGQVDGPLLPLARTGGDFLVVLVVAVLGAAIAAVVTGWRTGHPGLRRSGTAVLVVFAGLTAAAHLVPVPEATAPLRVAYVQGGGVRGLRAVENTVTDVYGNQLEAQAQVRTPVDLVVWPEDVIDLPGPIAQDPIRTEIGALAKRLNTTIVAGVVEDFQDDKFKNAAVAWDRSGKIVDRYDKVHRVPFGEYVPARSLVSKLGDFSPVPRDAHPGKGDGLLLTRNVELGVMISYEVFFPERALIATRAGGELLLVPTNASSFKGRQVPEQEVAAAQLRAVSMGRDLVQAAPTGHSAFVDAHGNTAKVSKLGAGVAEQTTLQRRSARTPYVRWGDAPMVAIVLLLLIVALRLDRSVKSTL
ncbi:MAG: apolipoprotein N-acyltransferase [Acidimicrobiales bacterium]|nr:apolipoprotein N-acyltransferase [Acidimicrobiales bacterium]